ncbi:MAG: alpha/beta hydrolase [Clostridiales bacterium]|nr:alpha/beta hydrolase [Clostridiales bacterium]
MNTSFDIVYDEKNNLTLDIYESGGEKDALFIYFHGGGLETGSKQAASSFAEALCCKGIDVASVEYRMYPAAKFPEFIEDCAAACAFIMGKYGYKRHYIGGSSAGAYLSMMLAFDKSYLGKYSIDADDIDGYVLDAGQPTTHFNILRERGIDTKAIRVDEAAPIYFIDSKPEKTSRYLIFIAERDISCRLEQNYMLKRTMLDFGYPEECIRLEYMEGYGHCGYIKDEVFPETIADFIG